MVNTNSSFPQEELKSFKDISFKLGSNSHLVQAAGGNTSIKSDGRMLIKASGTWLINSLDKDIFVEVDLNSISEKINNGKEDNFIDDIISKNNLHPSSETSFHALINRKYVLHVHSTTTIANAISHMCERTHPRRFQTPSDCHHGDIENFTNTEGRTPSGIFPPNLLEAFSRKQTSIAKTCRPGLFHLLKILLKMKYENFNKNRVMKNHIYLIIN